jgi:death-on-curing protein
MNEPRWLSPSFFLAVHDRLVADYGGSSGLRDLDRLEAAVSRPRLSFSYGVTDLHVLAGQYANAIVMGHPFIDGNKRVGFVAAVAFLEINGQSFHANEADAALQTLALAAGELSESAFVEWLRSACCPR